MAQLVDRVRDRFIGRLRESKQFAKAKRTLPIRTEVVHDLLEQFLYEEFFLYLPKKSEKDIDFIIGFLHEYLFSGIDDEDLLRSYNIPKHTLETNFAKAVKGFKQMYGDDIV